MELHVGIEPTSDAYKTTALTIELMEHICPASVERDSAISNLPQNFQLSDELTNWTRT